MAEEVLWCKVCGTQWHPRLSTRKEVRDGFCPDCGYKGGPVPERHRYLDKFDIHRSEEKNSHPKTVGKFGCKTKKSVKNRKWVKKR